MEGLMAGYSFVRVAYLVAYVCIEKEKWSVLRTFFYWMGNLCCLGMLGLAWRRM
jgi:hypothetical protein